MLGGRRCELLRWGGIQRVRLVYILERVVGILVVSGGGGEERREGGLTDWECLALVVGWMVKFLALWGRYSYICILYSDT